MVTPVIVTNGTRSFGGIGPVRLKILAAFVLIAGLVAALSAWFYLYGPCGTKRVAVALGGMRALETKWFDAVQVASATPRIALGERIARLQELHREAESYRVPSCAQRARDYLVAAMRHGVAGFIAFANSKESESSEETNEALESLKAFRSEISLLSSCAPLCEP